MSLGKARERFKDYEYVGYTSFNHLKVSSVDKFRLVFPLATPIPASGTFTDCEDLIDGTVWVVSACAFTICLVGEFLSRYWEPTRTGSLVRPNETTASPSVLADMTVFF